MIHLHRPILLAAVLVLGRASAAPIVQGDVTTALGPDFFFDAAATGGGDNNSTAFTRIINGYWGTGASVTLKGIGWASSSSGTTATSATVTFTDLGPDDVYGTPDDVEVGTVTDNLVFNNAAGEFVWDFDSDVTFTSTGTYLRIRITADGNIRRKTTSTTQTSQDDVKLSLAGTATGGEPPPTTNTATASGFWDEIAWGTGSGNVTGGVNDDDTAVVGSYRSVTYRDLPTNETLGTLLLGNTAANPGQGSLVIGSGTLTVSGDLTVGRGDSANDSFIHVDGGALHVGGNASFGRVTEACDGSLIVAGGAVTIDGDLAMGGFDQGGSMLRFHNPGSSPAVAVGGTLALGRCALDLTFDASYTHTPGTVIPLVSFAARDGQFVNFRREDEFNCGPNRFRIHYGPSSITLTALPNWSASTARPNIILIFSDDGGYRDLSLHGNPDFPTPELDSLATAGVRFTDHYVTGGVCHPSRCGLLSGIYQQRHGTDNNLSGPSYVGLASSGRTIPRRLQGLGYRTYGIGKWHLGDTVEFHPNCRGFDRWYGMWGGSRSYYDAGESENQVFQDQMTPDFANENTGYLTDRIGDATVDFIDEHLGSPHATEPFYIYVSFTAIHGPMDINAGDPRFARLQNEFGLTAADYQNSPIVFSGSNQATVDANRYELAAMTLAMDEQIGKIVTKLDAEGLSSNTLVVYTNDNGGAGWTQASGGNYSYNTPLRGYKGGSMTDGSIRVACAAKWPGTIPAGQVVEDPVISLDWGATFVNAAGDAPVQARNGLDGIDLMPRLTSGAPLPAERMLFWRAGGNSGGGSAARMGDWKLLIDDPAGAPRLYNLRDDIDENNDQSAAQPEILRKLLNGFLAWEARTLPPLYGTADTVLDSGLERQPFAGGLRLRTPSTTPKWVSSSFREPLSLGNDFDFSFLIRATETGSYPADAALWQGIGDSATRSDLIRAGIDFANGSLSIAEGKTGNSASVPIAVPADGFATATLGYRASTGAMTLSIGSTTVSLVLNGAYGALTHTAMGVSAMEGELSTLRPIAAGDDGMETSTTVDFSSDPFVMRMGFASEPPFAPKVERSAGLTGFTPDEGALVETLGGGLYQITTPSAGLPREFFRLRTDQP